ncbi:LysM peptidoglycan-binding domain-containing protein [Vagococcus luciliae]|uniref:LysM domain-containing protein n=1 Tax=Vagococcus luciliae TaxID=2920380 RepID=A0ABY5P1A6_9ENTE|nr:LysM domain-containing protein [Vagococcus luciliae]UUV99547.1 hypothetical protein G314FT_17080 [Vagococcus luciliae]
MSKDKNNLTEDKKEELNEQESWDQEIYEDDGSRTNRRSKSEKRTWFVVSIIVILFLIVLIPTGAIIYSQMSGNLNSGKTASPTSSTSVVSSSTTKESETKSTESAKSSTEMTESSSTTVESTSESFSDVEVPKNDPSTRGQEAQTETEQNNTTQQNQGQTASQTPGGGTVSYGQGDSTRSLWKISQEAGISLDQLYQLNPGVTAENVQPGQAIRVK